MPAKLGEIGKVLAGICEAAETITLLQKNSSELCKIIESTKDNASKVEAINLPQEPLLEKLKRELQKVLDSAENLGVWLKEFLEKIKDFKDFFRTKILCVSAREIPKATIREFSEKLDKAHYMTKSIYDAFNSFVGHLSKSQQLAAQLEQKLKQQSEEKDRAASSSENWGAAGTVGLAALGAGAAALGFFNPRAIVVATGAIAGTVCVAGAGAVATSTVLNVKEMRQLAADFKLNSSKLHTIASDLKNSIEKAGPIQLNEETEEALKTALEFFKRDMEKDARIAKLQVESRAKDARIAELEEQLMRQNLLKE